jgi:anion-transporting  ArsA/GET3 family ATPase
VTLLQRLEGRSILLVLGAGGVGKTTVAAAVAGILASRGRRVLAVTVDPSNRLRDSLGLSETPGIEEPVQLDAFGVPEPGGSLTAMVLDAQAELDRLVERLAPDAETRARVTGHVFYRKAAAQMAGTHEYMAMVRLLEAMDSGRYDLVVLDTPPDRHALDFLESPGRLDALLGSDVFRTFVQASSGLSRLGMGALKWRNVVLRGVGRFAGEETFLSVLDFILAFAPMFDEMRTRAARFAAALAGDGAGTLLVARPEPGAATFAKAACGQLAARGIVPEAVMVNRVHEWPPAGCRGPTPEPVDAGTLKDMLATSRALDLLDRRSLGELATDILRLASGYRDRSREDAARIAELADAVAPVPTRTLPLLRGDVRDLASLGRFARIVRAVLEEPGSGPDATTSAPHA